MVAILATYSSKDLKFSDESLSPALDDMGRLAFSRLYQRTIRLLLEAVIHSETSYLNPGT